MAHMRGFFWWRVMSDVTVSGPTEAGGYLGIVIQRLVVVIGGLGWRFFGKWYGFFG